MTDFAYLPVFPDGSTPYGSTAFRQLDGEFSVREYGPHRFLEVPGETLRNLSATAFRDIQHLFRPSHLQQLRDILDDPDASDNDRFVAREMLKNACTSAGMVLPSCQDTGTAIVHATKGQFVLTDGGDAEALSRGVFDVTAYGADPTTMEYGELFSGMQLGQLDGNIQPVFAHQEMDFYKVQDYLIFANQAQFIATFMANSEWHDGLSQERKDVVEEAVVELVPELAHRRAQRPAGGPDAQQRRRGQVAEDLLHDRVGQDLEEIAGRGRGALWLGPNCKFLPRRHRLELLLVRVDRDRGLLLAKGGRLETGGGGARGRRRSPPGAPATTKLRTQG